ncbi:MAG TPA: ATP-dependent DNA ligase, partial [bacterium]|nr:ATP-dependent DNA ligase [bacterium]
MPTARKRARRKQSRDSIPLTTAPMEAKLVDALPTDKGWQYEPKWDGFRCL